MSKRKQRSGIEREHSLDQSFRLKKISPMTDTQGDVFDAYYENLNLFLYGVAGTGKAQPLDSTILTPNGWVLMGDLRVNDCIISKNGTSCNIIGIFPQGVQEIVHVSFDDDRVVECGWDHLWKVYYDSPDYKDGKVVDTRELLRLKSLKSYSDRLRIDLFSPQKTAPHSLPLPPYIMGLLLGDGCFGKSFIGFTTADPELHQTLEESLIEGYHLHICGRYDNRITQGETQKNHSNFYVNTIRELGLEEKRSEEKWIPPCYLDASLSQRIELLQGLLDTDGTIDKSGSVTFCTASERLAKDVQYLVWSIGGIASIKPKQTFYTHKGEKRTGLPSFIVKIRYKSPKDIVSLKRKKERINETYQYGQNLRLGIKSIESAGTKPMQCIMIDDPDHQYITDNFIVTHNTYISLYLALKEVLNPNSPYRHVYMIRSSVPSRDMGFMPGKLSEKMAVYEAPYMNMINDLFSRGDAYQIATLKNVFQMVSTSFLRGITFDNCIVIADEVQNCSFQELDTLITRIGNNTKMIICGDLEQCDLYRSKYDVTGLPHFIKILKEMESFEFIEFHAEDIVRSGLVKEYILEKRKLEMVEEPFIIES